MYLSITYVAHWFLDTIHLEDCSHAVYIINRMSYFTNSIITAKNYMNMATHVSNVCGELHMYFEC